MGAVVRMWDRLTNIVTGMGTTADKRTAGFYSFIPVTGEQAEAAYRSSWLVRKIVDIPPFDMTRGRRDWQAEGTDIEKIEAEERRLQVWPKLQRALVIARLFGGSGIIIGTRDNPELPLRPETIKAGGLEYLHVMSCNQLNVDEPILDPADPLFGQPKFFSISGGNGRQAKIHPSRVIAFVGQRAPEGGFYPSVSWFWGDPIMQSIGEAVKNADLAQSGFASLIDRAAVDVFKFKDLMSQVGTAEGEATIQRRVDWVNQAKSNMRAIIADTEDEWQQVQVNFSNVPETLDAFLRVVAGAADIPVTRLLGQSPKGLQSTGDGEERDYHSMVKARQNELLQPALDRLDPILIRSALGSVPSDIYWEFAPLGGLDEKEEAEIEAKFAQALSKLSATGEFQGEVLAKAALNRMVESGRWPGLEKAIDDAGNDGVADEPDEADATTLEQRVAAMEGRGTVTADQALNLIRDAAPRTLYVSRKLLNADKLIAWAKAQGLETTVPAGDMHVTVLLSRAQVDWMKMGSGWDQDADGKLRVPPGGARLMEGFGDAVVLLFTSSSLSWRHEDMVRNGASHDFDSYQPHVTITYEAPEGFDLSTVEPYRGELVFGPEIFEEVNDDWKGGLEEE